MNPVFYFDFGGPNAYLAHRVLPGIEARTGCPFTYVPISLGGLFKLTGNQAPMVAYAHVPNKLAYEKLEFARFIERHRLTAFTMNPYFPINTLPLMRAAVAAEAMGLSAQYIEAMFHFMWEQPRNLGDPAIFATSLVDSGLPADTLIARSQDESIKQCLVDNTQAAFEHGGFGVPTFLVGTELFFGKERLGDVEAAIVAQSEAGTVPTVAV